MDVSALLSTLSLPPFWIFPPVLHSQCLSSSKLQFLSCPLKHNLGPSLSTAPPLFLWHQHHVVRQMLPSWSPSVPFHILPHHQLAGSSEGPKGQKASPEACLFHWLWDRPTWNLTSPKPPKAGDSKASPQR